jgi:AraC-like DNA-binding protein
MKNLYLVGFAQALFFVMLILTKKNKNLSDYFLAFFILLLGGQLFWVYSYYGGFYRTNPWILIVDIYYWTLLGPTLLVYIQLLTKGKNHLNWKHFLLLIPTFLVTIGFAEYIFIDGSHFFTDRSPKSLWFDLSVYVWYYNAPLFYIYIILQLFKHNKRIKHYYSNSKNVDLKWLNFLTYGFMLFLILLLSKSFFSRILNVEYPSSLHYTWPVFVIYVFGIGYFGYKQKGIFSQNEILEMPTPKNRFNIFELNTNDKVAYQKSGLGEKEAEDLSKKIIHFMESEKIYLDCDLNLASLSKIMDTTTHKLSQVINSKFGKNFFEFVNDYRIEEVKNLLKDPDNNKFKIIILAYDCGFNTKSTFYTLFKKNTSITPAEFRARYQKQAV